MEKKIISPAKEKSREKSYVQTFMAEIKSVTGLTHAEIAEQLDTRQEAILTETTFSQYLNGSKPMSDKRLLELAKRTRELGWNIPCVEMMLEIDMVFSQQWLHDSEQRKRKNLKKIERSKLIAIQALTKNIHRLVKLNLDDKTIVALVVLLTQKYSEYSTNGGEIDLPKLAALLGVNNQEFQNKRWLHFDFLTSDEAEGIKWKRPSTAAEIEEFYNSTGMW